MIQRLSELPLPFTEPAATIPLRPGSCPARSSWSPDGFGGDPPVPDSLQLKKKREKSFEKLGRGRRAFKDTGY